ncbi:hypothetical protein PIB30_012889, partial [Stylosanthes scabra]|nr:hypothetical protein [Stylosanthes scabra]
MENLNLALLSSQKPLLLGLVQKMPKLEMFSTESTSLLGGFSLLIGIPDTVFMLFPTLMLLRLKLTQPKTINLCRRSLSPSPSSTRG